MPASFHRYLERKVYGFTAEGQGTAANTTVESWYTSRTRQLLYRFYNHFHPYVDELSERLTEGGIQRLLGADTEEGSTGSPVLREDTFQEEYSPSKLVDLANRPIKELEFGPSGAYSLYNWELFFHVPLMLGTHLSRAGRYAEARKWFHQIFDPTTDAEGSDGRRFWKVKPFADGEVELLKDVLLNLSSSADTAAYEQTVAAINAWRQNPFRPHLVARYRPTAYMFKTVMAYLDNLIAWGDSLFREDTRESINEALQLYVLAAGILGSRPQQVPSKRELPIRTYSRLRAQAVSVQNALKDVEADLPADAAPLPLVSEDSQRIRALDSIGQALFFCVPANDRLSQYWDTVADRLFKIRNSLNLSGIFRQLPLFAPPIDPALLARAAAAGVDVSAVVSGTAQAVPLVRFQTLLRSALELCQEVKGLGNQLLSVLEKKDNEALTMLRQKHESSILNLVNHVRYHQYQEAVKAREALQESLNNAVQRWTYYERMLGNKDQLEAPELEALDTDALEKFNFAQAEAQMQLREQTIETADAPEVASGQLASGRKLSPGEALEVGLLSLAQLQQSVASNADVIAGFIGILPTISGLISPFGVGTSLSFGGSNVASMFHASASAARMAAGAFSFEAGMAGRFAGYLRREQEWTLQSNLAVGEMKQLHRQIRAAQIRESMAEREWGVHKTQIQNAEEVNAFLQDEKTTNVGFYAWLHREVQGLHAQCYQFAFDVAKKAERALQYELGKPEANYLKASYFGGREGLLAGEKLFLDLKQMELAYFEENRREYELTRHVSVNQLDPLAVLSLRKTGRCTVSIPEELYDLDAPGHYFRRIKGVAVSLPSVVGPYTPMHCRVTMTRSSFRKDPTPPATPASYPRQPGNEAFFVDVNGAAESIVTSGGASDTGLFDASLRDERLLPFEGKGAIATFELELPSDVKSFDYNTISDVVFHIRYTAREGGATLARMATDSLKAKLSQANSVGNVRLLSIRHEFPVAWAALKAAALPNAKLEIDLKPEHYPYWSGIPSNPASRVVDSADLYVPSTYAGTVADTATSPTALSFVSTGIAGLSRLVLKPSSGSASAPPPLTGLYDLFFREPTDLSGLTDAWLVIRWR